MRNDIRFYVKRKRLLIWKLRILIHLDVSSNPNPFPRSFEIYFSLDSIEQIFILVFSIPFGELENWIYNIVKMDDQRENWKKKKKDEIVINLGRDIGFNKNPTHIFHLCRSPHTQHGHILIILLDLVCMSFRGSVSGSLGGCHRFDAIDVCERLRFLYYHGIRSLLVNGLSEYIRSHENGYGAIHTRDTRTFYG